MTTPSSHPPDDPTARHRLVQHVTGRVHADNPDIPRDHIERIVLRCRSDLDIVHLDSLPELLERQELTVELAELAVRAVPAAKTAAITNGQRLADT